MRGRLIIAPIATAVAAAALAAPLVVAQAGVPRHHLVVPGAFGWQTALFWFGLLMPLWYAGVIAVVLRPALARLRRGWRWLYVIGTWLVQAAVAVAMLAAAINTDPDLLRGDVTDRVVSPDGARTAYVVTGGMMCGYDVFIAERGASTMWRAGGVGRRCDEQDAGRVRWIDADTVELFDDGGVVSIIDVPPR